MEILRVIDRDGLRLAEVLFRGEDYHVVTERVSALEALAGGNELFWRSPPVSQGPYADDSGGMVAFQYSNRDGVNIGACAYLKLEKP